MLIYQASRCFIDVFQLLVDLTSFNFFKQISVFTTSLITELIILSTVLVSLWIYQTIYDDYECYVFAMYLQSI